MELRRFLVIAFFVLTCASLVLAQTPTGTLQGTVSDASGGAVSGAKVTVTDVNTNQKKELETDSAGRYVVPLLNPSTYSVSVQSPAFSSAKEDNIKIDVSQTRSVNITLAVGAFTQEVEVQAEVTPLDTDTATTGTVIDTRKVVDLPLNGRNPFALAGLVPGVSNVGGASTPHIGGSRNAVNEEQLDGMTNILPENNVGNNVSAYTPIVDSVQEFSVQTNSLSAEYGRFGGGVINLVTKSGTNQWHGGLFEFSRNTVLNANDFFANRAGQSKPSGNERQYGGTLGGPIQIPHVYDGHNRSFFFFGFQGDNAGTAAVSTDTVPTVAFRNGDFSSLGTTIYDPLSAHLDPSTGNYVRTAFVNNMIPSTRFDPVAVKALSYFPLPNTGAPGAQTNNFVAVGTTTSDDYKWDTRIDHNFTDKWHMFLRVSHDWAKNTPLFDYGSNDPGTKTGSGLVSGGAWSVSMDHTVTFSPTMLGDFRYGFARSYVTDNPLGSGFSLTSLGLPASLQAVAAQRVLEFPEFSFSNGAQLGNGGYVALIENPMAHDFTGSLTKILAHHTIKFGGEFRRMLINFTQYGFPSGQFNFDQTWTQQIAGKANGTGSPYASFLIGLPSGGQVTHEPTASDGSNYVAAYIQDDWKVRPNLTVNLGLRWDMDSPRTERYNRLSYWDPTLPSPIQGLVPTLPPPIPGLPGCLYCSNLVGQMVFVGTPASKYGRHQGPYQKKDFGPRLGVAYSPTRKLVIRSGFGISYAPSALQAAGTTGAPGVQGFGNNTFIQSSFNNQQTVAPGFSLSNPFPNGFNLPAGAAGGPSTNLGLGIGESFFDSYRNPYSIEWNFNIQHQLPWQMTAEVGYIGNRGLFLVDGEVGQPFSQVSPIYASLGNQLLTQVPNPFYGIITTPGSPLSQKTISYNRLLRPFPQYDGVSSFRKPRADSIYHGVIARLDKHFSNGLTLLVSFTGGKSMDNSASAVGYLGPISGTRADQYNGRLEWAISPQDVSRSLVASFVYQLPFGKGKPFVNSAPRFANLLISGWEVNGILTFATGTPVILSGAISQTNLFDAGQRPDNTGQSAKLSNQSIAKWFNTSVFNQPPPFTFGTTGRTLPDVRNPGESNADLSLFKNNYFGKENRCNLQFRIEAFNALNHPQFGAPNTSLQSGGAFGTISSLAIPSRVVQLAAKFNF